MEAAGAMRWSPDQFWLSTPPEFLRWITGFALSKGAKPKEAAAKLKPPTRAEFDEWKRTRGRGQ